MPGALGQMPAEYLREPMVCESRGRRVEEDAAASRRPFTSAMVDLLVTGSFRPPTAA